MLICSGILIALIVIFLYSIGLFTSQIATKLAAVSAVLGLIMLIVIIRMLFSYNRSTPLLTLSNEGIRAEVTPVSKAAGLISWRDVVDVSITKAGWDTLVVLRLTRPEFYMQMIQKKLSAMAVSGLQDDSGNLQVFLTASELDVDASQLLAKILDFRNTVALNDYGRTS